MSLSRCVRCERLYSPGDEQDQCWYHPGQHRRLGWTCCRDPSQTAHGCRFGVHLEDESATAALDQLWLRPSEPLRRPHLCATDSTEASDVVVFQDPSGTMCVAQQPQLKTEDLASTPASGLKLLRPAMTTSVPINCKQDEAPADPSEQAGGEGGLHGSSVLVPYLVGPYDTFSAICMRHQMESEELQRLNGLKRRCVRPGSTLLVWAQRAAGEVREEMQRTQMLAFQRHCKCTAGEARYYLESNDYKMDLALLQRQAEVQWEKNALAESATHELSSRATRINIAQPPNANGRSQSSWLASMSRCIRCVAIVKPPPEPVEL